MSRCIFCNKFSLLLNELRICRSCFNRYSSEAIRVCEEEINPLFEVIQTPYNSLDTRKAGLDKLKTVFENYLQRPAGKIWVMYNHFSYDRTKLEIEIEERKINNELHEREILKYSKVEAAPDNYIVFDLETTGLEVDQDTILEIGAIKYINGVEVDRFHTYVNPERSIPRRVSEINHITASKIKKTPTIRFALSNFIDFIENYTLIAYNSDFDMGFIQTKCYYVLHQKVENDVIDALPLARKYLSELPNKKLETAKQHFNLSVGSHNAIDDCIVTNHLYQYCKQFEDEKYKNIIPFPYGTRELSATEIEYIDTIVELCEKLGIDRKKLSLSSVCFFPEKT